MASSNRKKVPEPRTCEFTFDGGLESSVRGGLIVELVKYILYERQQIPDPYDAIVTEIKQFTEENGVSGDDIKQLKVIKLLSLSGECVPLDYTKLGVGWR